jgi:crossover junction endonuclease EME1
MPAEVISLLSSSPVAAAPSVALDGQEARPKVVADTSDVPTTRLDRGGTVDLFDDDVEMETTSSLPVSSRPPKRPLTNRRDANIWQGDFDTPDDDSRNRRDISGLHPSKRSRPSGSAPIKAASSVPKGNLSSSPIRSLPLNTVEPKRGNILEPIDLSSPPRLRTRELRGPTSYDWNLDLDHNPFASSSPRGKENEKLHAPGATSKSIATCGEDFGIASLSGDPRKLKQVTASSGTGDAWDKLIDDGNPFTSSLPLPVVPAPKIASTSATAAAWDPISSSAPQAPRNPQAGRISDAVIIDEGSSEDEHVAQATVMDSEDEFPDINSFSFKDKAAKSTAATSTAPKAGRPKVAAATTTTTTMTAAEKALEKERKAADRSRTKDQRAAEKEVEKERKAREKELAKQQKEHDKAMQEVNKVRTDKKVSRSEMIVFVSPTLPRTTIDQITAMHQDMDVAVHEAQASSVANVVTWKRKVDFRWNQELRRREPVPVHTVSEPFALVILPAAQYVKLVLGEGQGEGEDDGSLTLDGHVASMRRQFPGSALIYLIEGLGLWRRANRKIRNRQFTETVRNGLEAASAVGASSGPPPSSQQNPRRRKNAAEYVDEDIVADAELDLQFLDVLVHETSTQLQTAQQVATFTEQISLVPYKRERQSATTHANFCMDSGQVATGDNRHDVYVRMLQEIKGLTPGSAYGIAAEFASVTKLVRGLEANGHLCLENVMKSANKNGAFSNQRVGPSISRRLYKIFTGTDADSDDV